MPPIGHTKFSLLTTVSKLLITFKQLELEKNVKNK